MKYVKCLFKKKQKTLIYISRGYTRYVQGEIPADKIEKFALKISTKYLTEANKNQRYYRKSKNKGNAVLLIYPKYGEAVFHWWVLLTDGEHPAEKSEKIYAIGNARKRGIKLNLINDFEPIMQPSKGGAPRWTCRLNQDAFNRFSNGIEIAIRHRKSDEELKAIIKSFHRLSGFRGVRNQIGALRKKVIGEWRRNRSTNSCPHIPEKFPKYVRFGSFNEVDLSLVVKRMKKGKEPFAKDWKNPKWTPKK